MAQKSNSQCVIRSYKPSDKPAVISLFHFGILEHVYPAFFKSMTNSDHIGVTFSISVAGYVLGGSSYFQALLFGAAWAGLVYYCCHEIYEGYLKRKLAMEMADIQANFLDNPVNNFWVAEMEVHGRLKVVGLLAVVGVKSDRSNEWNGGPEDGVSLGGSVGEVFQLIVSYSQRRKGLGTQLAETAIEFCKEQGLSRVVVETSSPQTAAIALFRKLGFTSTSSHDKTHSNPWISKLARINVMRMEKTL